MNILIELLDKDSIRNLTTWNNFSFDRVIFLYRASQKKLTKNPVLRRLVDQKGTFQVYDSTSLLPVLDTLLELEGTLWLDVDGGKDVDLAVACQWAKEKPVKLVYPDGSMDRFVVLEGDQRVEYPLKKPRLKVEEIIQLYGGSLRADQRQLHKTLKDNQITQKCVELMERENSTWTGLCSVLARKLKGQPDKACLVARGTEAKELKPYIQELVTVGLFEFCNQKEDSFSFRLKAPNYRPVVEIAGTILEYQVYQQLLDAQVFDDVLMSGIIDWNGGAYNPLEDATSEIDDLAVYQGTPIFISCKLGKMDLLDLYEIKVNAETFGGEMALPVMIHYPGNESEPIRSKAEDLGILLLDNRSLKNKRFVSQILHYLQARIQTANL